MKTTVGQLLINEALPEDLRDYSRTWDKQTTKQVMRQVAEKHPEDYREISRRLVELGQHTVASANFSFGLSDFTPGKYKKLKTEMLRRKSQLIIDNNKLTPKQKQDKLVLLLGGEIDSMVDNVLEDGVKGGSRLADIIKGGAKGSSSQYNTTVGAPLMVLDHKDDPVPIPILNSVSEGYDPVEYWASAYGTRKGLMSTKIATQDAGYFGKKLALAGQRGVVTEEDCESRNGISVEGGDPNNVGTILQAKTGSIPAGTVIKPEHLKQLKGNDVIVRSPITCQAGQGICSRCAGIRDSGNFPAIGDNIGVSAATVLGEKLSQTALNVKHGGGAAGDKKHYSFADVTNLFEMPKHNIKSAVVAAEDGVVKDITEAPAGGYNIHIGDSTQYVRNKDDITVKTGDHIQAGDLLSDGIPNPKELARYRGIGGARMKFMKSLQEVAGKAVNRRNAEVMSRMMINHIKVTNTKGTGNYLTGDIIKYDDMVRDYVPREGSEMTPTGSSANRYLEQPVLHHTIGSKVDNRMLNDLKQKGIKDILTHNDVPDFEPEVQRLYDHSQRDPDWMARMGGYKLKDKLLEGTHRGAKSDPHSTSYIPALAMGTEFGTDVKKTGLY